MKKFKRQFLAEGLVLALGAAVYLNWTLSGTKSVSRTLGESKFVNATVSTSETTKPSKKTNANTSGKESEFFTKARTNRDKIQDKVIDTAKETLDLENASEKELSEAQNQVAKILKNFTLQDSIETNLKAKGFSDVVCYLSDDGCTVNVLKSEMKKGSEMQIKAVVTSASNIGFDKITINAV